ncbi:MAG: 30S ribosome-binding factor RbfA [Lachnospiraceae bacterium]|nr:30S ribosome-binding factor RbfA [Lachnospiraceae bacterium]
MKKNSIKNERINAEVQRALSRIIREEVKDPRIPVMVSVTQCKVAPDLKTCKAYISILGDEAAKAECHAALKSAAGFIRHGLAGLLNMRITPEITFVMDDSIQYGVEMSQKIDEVMARQNAESAGREENAGTPDPMTADSGLPDEEQ